MDILTKNQSERFLMLIDTLAYFANQDLGIVGGFLEDGFCDDSEHSEVLQAIWANPKPIISKFVMQNPAGLSARDLREIASWASVIYGPAVIVDHTPDGAWVMVEDRIVLVKGVTTSLAAMIRETPKPIEMALLPFDGAITYGVHVMEFPVVMGAGMRSLIHEQVAEARKQRLIRTAADLIAFAPALNEKRLSRELEEMEREMQREADKLFGREKLPEGFHRGVLAGMDPQQREERIQARVDELSHDTRLGTIWLEDLKSRSVYKKPRTSYAALLKERTRKDLLQGFIELSDPQDVKMIREALNGVPKASLIELMLMLSIPSVSTMEEELSHCDTRCISTIKQVLKQGGTLSLTDEQVMAGKAKDLVELPGYVYLFHYDHVFTWVVMEEQCPLLEELDYDKIERSVGVAEKLFNVANAMVELCGLVPIDDVIAQFEEWHGKNLADRATLRQLLIGEIRESSFYEIDIWTNQKTMYLIDMDLAPDRFELSERKQAQQYLEYLVKRHETMGKPVLDPILASAEPVRWKTELPACHALSEYFDTHIPDGQDDYFFAERMVEEVVLMMRDNCQIPEILQYLSDQGAIGTMEMTEDLLGLLNNCWNTLPRWENNGFSPVECSERLTGRKVFLDEKGKPRKIGRNDPCPCGSGKKYKHCCGKLNS